MAKSYSKYRNNLYYKNVCLIKEKKNITNKKIEYKKSNINSKTLNYKRIEFVIECPIKGALISHLFYVSNF